MNLFLEIGWHVLKNVPSFFINPAFYLFIVLIYLQYNRNVQMERKLFHVGIHSALWQTLESVLYGLAAGLVLSVALVSTGVVIRLEDFAYIWIIALILAMFNIRFLCFAYAAGILALLKYVAASFPDIGAMIGIHDIWLSLSRIHPPSLFILVAVMHLAEAVLVRMNGDQGALPLFIDSRRGRLVGAFQLQKFWLLPLFLLIGTEENTGISPQSTWWPLFFDYFSAYLILPFPAVIGFSDMAVSRTKKEKTALTFVLLLMFSLILLTLAVLTEWLGMALGILAAGFSLLGHEWMIRFGKWLEKNKRPIFIQESKGIRVLEVIPRSPADQMGIESGELIVKVNGREVNRKEELYPALQLQPAFCKIDVVNREGVTKYLQRSLYDGEHHQLGIIIAPDLDTNYYVELENVNIFQLIKQKIKRKNKSIQGEEKSENVNHPS